MKKLDRFLVKSFIGPFVAILLVVVFILMMQFLWRYIDELVGKGLSLGVILEFLMWGTFTIAPLALPLAALLSSMMVIGQMAENKEMLAVKAAGIPFMRLMAPMAITAVFISIGAYFIGDKLVPVAYNKIFTLRDDIGRTKNEIKIPSGTFYDGIEGYILRIGDQDKASGMMRDVMVYDHSSGRGNVSVTVADSARMGLSKSKDYLTFDLFSGTSYLEDNTLRRADTNLTLQRMNFARQELIISLSNYQFEKSDSTRYGDQSKSKPSKVLRAETDSLKALLDEKYHKHIRTFRQLSFFVEQRQLDSSFHDSGRQAFDEPELMNFHSLRDKYNTYSRASMTATRISNELANFNHEISSSDYYSRIEGVELLQRIAQALACLILFFVGAPLGSMIKKGELGTSAIISVLFFVLYWVVDISATKLARDGAISIQRGAFLSSIVLAPIGVYLTYRASKDKEFLNMSQLKVWWKLLVSKVSRFFKPIRIVYMGTPDFAVAPLDSLIAKGYNVVGVVTVADKPSGRGLKVNESAVKRYAVEHGIPVLQPQKLKDPEFLEALKAWKADLFVVVAFRMLPEEVWNMPRLGTFNLHAALLPQYRGAAPINWAVINGEKISGVTTFFIDKDIDTGKIIYRQECRIGPEDSAGDLHDSLMEIGADLVCQTVEGIISNNVETRLQRSFIQGSEVLKSAPKLNRELCHIDWEDSSRHIHNLIRGLSPYPGAFTEIVPAADPDQKPQNLKIYKARRSDSLHGNPGEILSDGKDYLAIATLDGAIELLEIQLAGKKRMEVRDFLKGFREPCSYVCTKGSSKAEILKTKQS